MDNNNRYDKGTGSPPVNTNQWCEKCKRYTYFNSGGCTLCEKKIEMPLRQSLLWYGSPNMARG